MENLEKKEKRFLPVRLGETELVERAKELARSQQDIASLEEQKKTATADLTAQIKKGKQESRELTRIVSSGIEDQDVDCTIHMNYEDKRVMVTRDDTGEVVEERSMSADELQLKLAQKKKGKVLAIVGDAKPKKNEESAQSDDNEEDLPE